MNIDYEAIVKEAGSRRSDSAGEYARRVIEAYERQKAAPEWVPLDLAVVKQGQEVRMAVWAGDYVDVHEFVALYEGDLIVSIDGHPSRYRLEGVNWLMRAPKPKTVRVRVFKHKTKEEYVAVTDPTLSPDFIWKPVGEGEIEVRE